MIKPEWGIWFILTALLPLILRIIGGRFRFDSVDWLVVVFAATVWAGYWAAYDQATAWNKAWLIMTAVLLYFSLKVQLQSNLFGVSVFLFCLGVGVSLYYFLTHDFVALPRKLEFVNQIGRWIMNVRPQTGWAPIHPNYVAGMIAVTVPFIFYPVWSFRKNNSPVPALFSAAIMIGLGFAGLALVMATSRGVVFAILGGAGGWLLWRAVNLDGIRRQFKSEAAFPILLLVYLGAVVAFLYVGPARSGSLFSGNYYYGDGSRAELFSRSLFLLLDYPITGGGLGSFPGLYSQYMLGIPFFNVPNSHNLFLDVGIEQGLFGGLAFFCLYLAGLWTVSSAIAKEGTDRSFKWVVLFSLIVAFVHGMVDNYLYNGAGTVLSLFLVGLSMNGQGYDDEIRESRIDLRTVGVIAIIWVLVAVVNLNQIRAIWHANVGAVQLAKVELDRFPNDGWAGDEIIPRLETADVSLRSSLQFDPANRTANQRLGMISMYRRDYASAVRYLETARGQAPQHRGILKSLAYCYVWLGNVEKAQALLSQIPEAREELDVYAWWWEAQGRSDLSGNAKLALDALETASPQP
jgi:O-antigen ligase